MDLEKKVQMLEQELEILKNQIQETLLDIKEQLLTNAYPGLRSDEPQHAQVRSTSATVSVPSVEPIEEDGGANLSIVRKVSLNDLNQKAQPLKKSEKKESLNPETRAELDAWLSRLLAETSPNRCAEVIELYAETGRFAPLQRDYLLQSVKHQAQSRSKVNQDPKAASSKFRTTGSNAKSVAPVAAKLPEAKKTKKHSSSSDEDIHKNNLVLRLIAGIQNAGAGVKWDRKNG